MYENYNNYYNPLEDHLKEQAKINKGKSQINLVAVFFFGFVAGLIVYDLYQKRNREEEFLS